MKKMIIAVTAILFPVLLHAQSPLDRLFNKYNGHDGYTTVTINQSMFDLFASVSDDKQDADFKDITGKLTCIKILTCEGKLCDDLYREVTRFLSAPEYQELMNINDGSGNVRFLIRKSGDKILELVMAVGGKEEPCVISLQGEIDLKQISKLSRSMKINGMDKLGDISAKPKYVKTK